MTALAESPRQTGARFLMIWIVPVALLAAVSFAAPVLNDGDTFWHIAAGRWIIEHVRVPATDPFSFTFLGHPWIAHEWLTETLMAGAWLAGGWAGVMLLTAAALALTALLIGDWLLRWMGMTPAFLTIALALACISPGILARPHLTILPMMAFWTVQLLEAREAERAPPLWLALFMVLWANLHSSFVVGFAIAFAFGLEAFLSPRTWSRKTLRGWAIFLDALLIAMLMTPHGFDGVLFPLRVLNMKTLPLITEWQSPDFMKLSTLELALLAGVFFGFWRGMKLTAIRALIVLGLIHMALQHERQEVMLGAVAPLILAEPAGRALGRAAAAPVRWAMPLPQTLLGGGLLIAALVARLAVPQPRVDGPTAPITAFAHVPAALRAQPVLNAYDFGGFLIFEGVRPYIDGRADMYGDNFVNVDSQIQAGDGAALGRAIADYRIRWAILEPSLPVVGVLERTPGWTKLYEDRYAVVLQNTNAPTPSSPPPAPDRTSSVHG